MKTAIIPVLMFALCGTVLMGQDNKARLVFNTPVKSDNAFLKKNVVASAKTTRPAGFYLQKSTNKKPLIDHESGERKSSSTANTGVVSINVFPNPFVGDLNIGITDNSGSEIFYEALLFDLQGRKIFSQTLNSKKEKLNLSAVTNGMYILHVQKNGTTVLQEKLVKE